MSNEWDDKLTEKFLKLYRKHKCLWNPYSPNYRNCSVKNEAFKTVLQDLNDPRIKISECLQQIEVIREKYKEEQVRAENALKFGKLYNSKVPWFNLMSQMLCEVINDEENFIDDPVEFVPCNFAKGETNQGRPAKQFANLLNASTCVDKEFEHINSVGLKKQHDVKSFDNNFRPENKLVNDTKDPWNKCPSCGWGTKNIQDRTFGSTNRSEFRIKRVVRIDKEIQNPHLRMESTETDDVDKSTAEINKEAPSIADEMNRSSHWASEIDGTRPKKKVTIVEDVEESQDSKEKCACTEAKKPNVTEGANDSSEAVPSNVKNAHCPRNEQECVNNDQSQNQIVTANRYDSCLKRLGECSSNFPTMSDEDVSSRFKIIIPNPDEEDQNLEIIGYQVREPVAELSKYVRLDSGAESRRAAEVTGADCLCKNEASLLSSIGINDSTRYGNIIKLNISQKRSTESRLKKRSHQEPVDLQAEDKSFATRSTQTERGLGNCTNRSEDQGYASDFSSSNVTPLQSRLVDESIQSESLRDDDYGSVAQEDRLRNTRIFLNIVFKILESDETEVSENLQNTLESMLDRFEDIQSRSMAQNATGSNNTSRERTRDGTMHSTRYPNLPMAVGAANTRANNMNPQRRRDRTVELNDTPNVDPRPQFQFPESRYRGEVSGNDTSYFLPVERRNPPVNQGVNASQQNSRMLFGTNSSINGSRRSRNATLGSERGEQNSSYWRTIPGNSDSYQQPEDGRIISARRGVNRNQQNSSYPGVMPGDDSSYLLPEANGRSNAARRVVDRSKPNSRFLNESNIRNASQPADADLNGLADGSVLAGPNQFSPADPLANSTVTSDLDDTIDFVHEPLFSSSRQIREPRNRNQLTQDFLDVIRYTMMMDGIEQIDENGEKNCCNRTNQPTDPKNPQK